jgi:uncharacterized membrane protein
MDPSPFPFDPFQFIGVTVALSFIVPLIITGAVIGVIIWAVRRSGPAREDPAVAELKSRLARGEIDPTEYEVRMRALRGRD